MSKLELKSAFIGNIGEIDLVRDFLISEIKIEVIQEHFWQEREILLVPQDAYERALLEGRKYVAQKKFESVNWKNYYGQAENCRNLQLAVAILEGRKIGLHWCLNQYLPKDVLEYLRQMRASLGIGVDQSYWNFGGINNGLCLEPRSFDYDRNFKLLNQFIEKEGTGPFTRIVPLAFTGEVQKEENFPVKVKK